MSALDPLSPGGEDLSTLSQDSESDLLPDSSGDEASLDGRTVRVTCCQTPLGMKPP